MRAALNEGLAGPSSSSPSSSAARGVAAGAAASLVVGSDIPDLQPGDVGAAVDALYASTSAKADDQGGKSSPDCILGPAVDGGFWVVGVTRRRRSRGGGKSDHGSPSSLLLPDELFEVRLLLFF